MPLRIKIKAVKIGSSTRMTIPKEVCEALNIKPGDILNVGLTNKSMIVKKVQE